MRYLGCLFFLTLVMHVNGQSGQDSLKKKKQVGQPTLTFDIGLFLDASRTLFIPSQGSQGLVLGVEKKRQKLLVGPTFGNNIYYSKPNNVYGLTGFIVDYSFIFYRVIKHFDLAVFTQFQYNYQDRVVYYGPPAETLILKSRYQELFYGFIGLDAKFNFFNNLQVFFKVGLGIERRITQVHFPYYPPYNKYKKEIGVSPFRMMGITYGFPTKKKLPTA